MARSTVLAKDCLAEIRHEINQAHKSKEFPDKLLLKWFHKDECETALRLGGLINQLFRKNGTVAIQDNLSTYEATASHTSASVTVSGFTGLTPDAFIGGTVMTIVSGKMYTGQIIDNDATTLTLSSGTDLPVMTDDPVMVTSNNSKYSADLSGLRMINYAEPIWQVLDGSGEPIEPIDINEARNILNDPIMEDEAYYYVLGQTLQFAAGSNKALSGNFTVGYYILPVEMTALTDYVDFPQEWHDLIQQRVMIRVQKKLGNLQSAQEKELDLEKRWREIEVSNMNAQAIDKQMGERK